LIALLRLKKRSAKINLRLKYYHIDIMFFIKRISLFLLLSFLAFIHAGEIDFVSLKGTVGNYLLVDVSKKQTIKNDWLVKKSIVFDVVNINSKKGIIEFQYKDPLHQIKNITLLGVADQEITIHTINGTSMSNATLHVQDKLPLNPKIKIEFYDVDEHSLFNREFFSTSLSDGLQLNFLVTDHSIPHITRWKINLSSATDEEGYDLRKDSSWHYINKQNNLRFAHNHSFERTPEQLEVYFTLQSPPITSKKIKNIKGELILATDVVHEVECKDLALGERNIELTGLKEPDIVKINVVEFDKAAGKAVIKINDEKGSVISIQPKFSDKKNNFFFNSASTRMNKETSLKIHVSPEALEKMSLMICYQGSSTETHIPFEMQSLDIFPHSEPVALF
jgi:hypothetical protein